MSNSLTEEANISVFCQITGREISAESCTRTQGQDGCFGCAAPTRVCEECEKNYVVVGAIGTCSACTAQLLQEASRPSAKKPDWPDKVKCQALKRTVDWKICKSIEGQEDCKGCASPYRTCEGCGTKVVKFPSYGLCLECTVNELGEGWNPDIPDRPVVAQKLQVLTTQTPTQQENAEGIQSVARDFRRVELAKIQEPEFLLRQSYDEDEIDSLGESMLDDGMIYPVILEQVSDDEFKTIIGSRRIRAARKKEAKDIPAFVVAPQSPLPKLILMLGENLHRVNLDPFEEGRVFLRLRHEHKLEMSEVAKKLHRSKPYILSRIQLLSLPKEIQQMVAEKKLSCEKAATLAKLPSKEQQLKLAHEACTHAFTSSELRDHVNAEQKVERAQAPIQHQVTVQKLTARLEIYSRWLQRAEEKLSQSTDTEEREKLIKACSKLRNRLESIMQKVEEG